VVSNSKELKRRFDYDSTRAPFESFSKLAPIVKRAKAWGIVFPNGSLAPIAFRNRVGVMEWANQRFISAGDYMNLGNPSAWYAREGLPRGGTALQIHSTLHTQAPATPNSISIRSVGGAGPV
jgi:hypothetical protein